MDNSPIHGFITRKEAAEKCKRAERTLQRYWSRAIELRNTDVLEHLKLRPEDGEETEGVNVTKELIEDLKKSRKNPTWYVHATWVEKTYGPRLEKHTPKPVAESGPERGGDSANESPVNQDTRVTLLADRIKELEQDKKELRQELTIKNGRVEGGQARLLIWIGGCLRSLPCLEAHV